MTKIVDLKSYRDTALGRRALGPWEKRFGEKYGIQSRLEDLSDKTLLALASPGEGSAIAYYELILGALGLGEGARFYYLDKGEQLKVMDIHLFLADGVRFELMRRLGWVQRFAVMELPLLTVVSEFQRVAEACRNQPPVLSPSHPDYESYERLTARDRESFIRRLLPGALEVFRLQLEGGGR